jgi:DNA-binding NtrC family response regulator
MKRHDPLDATTMGPSKRGGALVPVATIRFVYRGGEGIVDERTRPIAPGLTRVGRGAQDGLALGADPRASRQHAELHYRPAERELIAVDLGSRNGIHVNGRPVVRATLADGDVVRFGSSFAVVRFEDPQQLDAPIEGLFGHSPAMQQLRVAILRAAPRDATVLVTGESGAGKELVARALHDHGKRSGPFVAINCTAISEGVAESQLFGHRAGAFTGATGAHDGFFRAAEGGTLFLDEVGDMAPAIQPKLLRALETGMVVPLGATQPQPFAARVVAATNADLERAVAEGRFRADLYARLAQIVLGVPPLRARREDILLLLQPHLGAAPPLAPELVEALLLSHWPRNVRELIAIATQLAIWGEGHERLELDLVRDRLPATEPPGPISDDPSTGAGVPEKDELMALLAAHGGNVAAVAKQVGRSRAQVYRWMERHGLEVAQFRKP